MTCLQYNTRYACRTLCSEDKDCPAGFRCSETFTCGSNAITAGKYCAKPCSDVVTAEGSASCSTGFKCSFFCDATTHTPTLPTCDWEAGTLKSGACMADDDCAPGYYCLGSGGDAGAMSCTQGCRVNGDCTTGTCTGTLYCGSVATTYRYCK